MEQLSGTADDLSVLLGGLRVTTSLWCRAAMRPPWGVDVPARPGPVFWIPTRGESWLGDVRLGLGDLVVFPHGAPHGLRSSPGARPGADDLYQRSTAADRAELLCGEATVEGLPRVGEPLHVRGSFAGRLAGVVADRGPGSAAALARVTEELLIEAVRAAGSAVRTDGVVAEAVRLIGQDPARDWTVTELAARTACSRSAFAERFKAATGEPPMRYLTRFRLARAAAHLRGGDLPVSRIARLVGYDSDVALSRAFHRHFGLPPGAYRRRGRRAQDTGVDVVGRL
ncbi:MAG: AraC family transcriptional regulator [Nonomuraea sp.]|nr:AraC family transcriptional regulator [Nonomuraea sp.]